MKDGKKEMDQERNREGKKEGGEESLISFLLLTEEGDVNWWKRKARYIDNYQD